MLIAAIILIYVCNIINLILLFIMLRNDKKYMKNYSQSKCFNIIIRILSTLTYFKFHEIVFSNLCGVKILSNKVDSVKVLNPLNFLLFISLFFSVLIVIAASLISYSVQQSSLTSEVFIQSVDCIIVVVLNIIPTILVFRRK